jgi:Transposase DDE domain
MLGKADVIHRYFSVKGRLAMNLEETIIELYLKIEAAYEAVRGGQKIRQCGRSPGLSDVEVITLEIFGEMQGHHSDAAIWRYISAHWRAWFPKLGSYKAFVKQCANLGTIKQLIFAKLFSPKESVHITDGVPMPVCHLARAGRAKVFKGEASFGFCASKDEYYYGFKGHVIIDLNQNVVGFTLTAANVDEREVLDNLRGVLSGVLIGDKGLLSQAKKAELAEDEINLQTPLRDNMIDTRPKEVVELLLKIRRRVETVIGQLVEYFGFAKCRARDMWHLTARLVRKLMAYNLKAA